MYETLLRPHEVNPVPAPLSIREVSEKLKKAEQKREEKRLKQIANARLTKAETHGKRKREGNTEDELADLDDASGSKRVKTDDEDGTPLHLQPDVLSGSSQDLFPPQISSAIPITPPQAASRLNVSKALPEVRGHTSYLTFACLLCPKALAGIPEDVSSTLASEPNQEHLQATN